MKKHSSMVSVAPESSVWGDQGSWLHENSVMLNIDREAFKRALHYSRSNHRKSTTLYARAHVTGGDIHVLHASVLITPVGLLCRIYTTNKNLKEIFSFPGTGECQSLWRTYLQPPRSLSLCA